MIVAKVMLNSKKLRKHREQLGPRADKILDRAATQIQAQAILNTVRVKTAAMRNGWRVDTPGEFKRRIYNTQHYAIYHEMGTYKMAATPMLVPAVEKYRQKLTDSWKKLFEAE